MEAWTVTTCDDILNSASLKYKNKDYLGAITEYSLAIDLHPDDSLTYACRGVARFRLGNITSALSDYDRAIELNPKLAVAYYRRGYIHYLNKNYLDSITDYNQAIELNPNDAQSYLNRGRAYHRQHNEQDAIVSFRRAAILFKVQGNLHRYQTTMTLIENIEGDHTWASQLF